MNLPAETVQVSFRLPNDSNNAKLGVTVMVTGADGYQVALGWGELDPDYGAAPILLAYSSDSIELRDPGPAQP